MDKAGHTKYPLQGAFELTPRCNFDCKMCYVHLHEKEIKEFGRELSTAEWIHLGELAVDAGTLFLTITGGEPLVRPDFPEIYSALTEMGFLITLQTNLSLLNGKLMDLIADRPPRQIKSTLYAATDATYEKVCGIKEGLKKVRTGIENVLSADIPLTLVSTIIRDNENELKEMHQLAADYGIMLKHTHNVLNTVRNHNQVSIIESRILYEDLSQEEKCVARKGPHQMIRSPLEACGNYMYGGYWILWNGQLSLCAHMNLDYKPLEVSSKEINGIESCFNKMLNDLDSMYPIGCCDCCDASTYCSSCPAVLYAEKTRIGGEKCKTAYLKKQYEEKLEEYKNG